MVTLIPALRLFNLCVFRPERPVFLTPQSKAFTIVRHRSSDN
jgi:hypothetical protein